MLLRRKKIKLYPNENLAICAKKRAAQDGASAALSVEYTTPQNLIRDSWELYGDDRKLVSEMQRIILVSALLEQHGLEDSIGTAREVGSFLKDSYFALLETSIDSCETDAEKKIYDLACSYRDSLAKANLVEGCEACNILLLRLKDQDISFAMPCAIDGYVEAFYCDGLGLEQPQFDIDRALGPQDMDVFVPAGPTVIAKMAFDEVHAYLNDRQASNALPTSIALCAREPIRLFDAFLKTDIRESASLALKGGMSFYSTIFGKAFASFCSLKALADADDEVANTVLYDAWLVPASDFVSSPYSCLNAFSTADLPSMRGKEVPAALEGVGLQSIWRSDRTLNASDAMLDLITVSRTFELFNALSTMHDMDACDSALDGLIGIACTLLSGIQLEFERGAIQVLRKVLEASTELGSITIDPADLAGFIDIQLNVIDSSVNQQPNGSVIQFLSTSDGSCLGASTFDEVIICDVSDAAFNSRHSGSSLDRFASRLGIPVADSDAQKARISFFQAVTAASDKLVCIMPAHGPNAAEAFPSFCFDELIEARFGGVISAADVGKDAAKLDIADSPRGGLAKDFLALHVKTMGEENLQAGAGECIEPPTSIETFRSVERGKLYVLNLPSRLKHANGSIVSSASAVEEYLSCPYKWFIDRVIRPTDPSEDFGALERGTFAHSVLEQFYTRVKELKETNSQIIDDNQYREMLGKIFMQLLSEQSSLPLCSNRYIPRSRLEYAEAMSLKHKMQEAVVLERLLPNQFEPAAFEKWLDSNDESSRYAGFAISGMVDRIDEQLDGEGFYIIDYKGFITGFSCGEAEFETVHTEDSGARFDPNILPSHVQTLIYAQVVRRILGDKPCAAALYTSYTAKSSKGLVVGAFSTSVEGFNAISNARSRVDGNFGDFLDMVEEAIAERMTGIHDSYIGIEPQSKDSCKYCLLAQSGCC